MEAEPYAASENTLPASLSGIAIWTPKNKLRETTGK